MNGRNPGISSITWGTSTASAGLPICIRMKNSPPPNSPQTNLGNIVLGLTFQAVLALFISSPTSYPPLLTHLFGAAVLISFVVSFAGVFLQNAFPRIALLFGKLSALIAAMGVWIIASFLLTHQIFSWISWLPCAFSLIAFVLSFK